MSALGGTWMSQWNARAICGAQLKGASQELSLAEILPTKTTPEEIAQYGWVAGMPLGQTGPDGWCELFGGPNYNAQAEFEPVSSMDAQLSGANDFASSGVCLRNTRMRAEVFDGATQRPGLEGYQQFISWVKARLIAGHVVSIGVFDAGDDDDQYDHEVTVLRIGTNHDPTDASYYDDDVLYFDDHGVYTLEQKNGKARSGVKSAAGGCCR